MRVSVYYSLHYSHKSFAKINQPYLKEKITYSVDPGYVEDIQLKETHPCERVVNPNFILDL